MWHVYYLTTRPAPWHTDKYVSQFYCDILAEFGIPAGASILFIGDGNERSGAVAAGFLFMWCAAHLLNLAIQHTFYTGDSDQKKFVHHCAAVVSHFHHLPLATFCLVELLEDDVKSLKNRAET
jgi:hypothetical protein